MILYAVALSMVMGQTDNPPVALLRLTNHTKSDIVVEINNQKYSLKVGEVRLVSVQAGLYNISSKGLGKMRWTAGAGRIMQCDFPIAGEEVPARTELPPKEEKTPVKQVSPPEIKSEPEEVAQKDRGLIIMDFPKGASLFIDGNKVKSKRVFQTPPLPPLQPGVSYYYIIACEIERDGTTYRHEQKVSVQAGRVVRLKFDP